MKKELLWLHFMVIVGCILPFGNVILPYAYWKTRKSKGSDALELSRQARNILNFQLTWSLIFYAGCTWFWYSVIRLLSEGQTPVYTGLVWWLVLAIIFNLLYPLVNMCLVAYSSFPRLYYLKAIPFFRG